MKECPFCGEVSREFLPGGKHFQRLMSLKVIGGGFRKNALCPNCGSFDRERLIYLYLLHEAGLFLENGRSWTVLHIAPESRLERRIKEFANIDYVTGDLNREDVDKRIDVRHIPDASGTYDLIICNHVLEHVPDDRAAMSELLRVLKPGGFAILQVPVSPTLPGTFEEPEADTPGERQKLFGQSDHVRLYGTDYPERLEQEGFVVEAFSWKRRRRLFGGICNRFALIPDEILYVARR